MIYADEIKSRISMTETVRRFGFEPNRGGFIRCPFHAEKTASLRVYAEADKGWFCFGCRKGGDQIKFVAEMLGCSNGEAMQMLADLVGYTDPFEGKPKFSYYKKQADQMQRETNRKWLIWWLDEKYYDAMRELVRLERLIEDRKEIESLDDMTPEMVDAETDRDNLLLEIDRIDYHRRLHGQK